MSRGILRALALLTFLASSALATIAFATDFTLTGFGTLGYARSDQDYKYLRYIDDSGTLKADSLLGVQVEAQFNPRWGATIQAVASAPREEDAGWEARIRWAFLSFRPTNDWLLRAGRIRLPFFFNTQNAEVGVTYEQARLPVEVYSISPIYDFDGGSVGKTWALGNAEINLDAFWGKSDLTQRLFLRDANQAIFIPGKVVARGVVLSHASGPLMLRGGIHKATLDHSETPPVKTFIPTDPFSPIPPPLGGTLFVPGQSVPFSDIKITSIGADWRARDWRVTAEYAQRNSLDVQDTGKSRGGYITVARTMAKWTPYVTYARLLSESSVRRLIETLDATPVPLIAQDQPFFLPASYHRMLADQGLVYDQYSTMVGASYSFSATSKLKFEWMRTKVGQRSVLVDGDVRDTSFNVLSMSYSVAF